MRTIVFENPGEVDIRLLHTFGAHVKGAENPIGYFGTGFKYAVAILLRSGHHIAVQSGTRIISFGTQKEVIRDKEFEFVTIDGHAAGFTTEVGKDWPLWTAFRELYSNTLDEGGHVFDLPQSSLALKMLAPEANLTRVIVMGDEFAKYCDRRDHLFIPAGVPPIYANEIMRILPQWESDGFCGFYFRGVLANDPTDWESMPRYNYDFVRGVTLAEDRTIRDTATARYQIAMAILKCDDNESIIEQFVTAPSATFEGRLDFYWPSTRPSETFMRVLRRLTETKLSEINPSALTMYNSVVEEDAEPSPMILNDTQRQQLERALIVCRAVGCYVAEDDLNFVEKLGSNTFGAVFNKKIYIARLAFDEGTKWLAMTIIEEHYHALTGFSDRTRELQTYMLRKIVSLGETLADTVL